MSMMRCDGCDGIIDTDSDVEGIWEDENPFRFWCSNCVERASNPNMLRALAMQEPERYAEIMEVMS